MSAVGFPTYATSKSTSARTSQSATIPFTSRASPMHIAGGAAADGGPFASSQSNTARWRGAASGATTSSSAARQYCSTSTAPTGPP